MGAGFGVFGCEWWCLGVALCVSAVPAPGILILGETWTVSVHPGKTLVAEVVSQDPLEELDTRVGSRKYFSSL